MNQEPTVPNPPSPDRSSSDPPEPLVEGLEQLAETLQETAVRQGELVAQQKALVDQLAGEDPGNDSSIKPEPRTEGEAGPSEAGGGGG